jgi:hypothetical protein
VVSLVNLTKKIKFPLKNKERKWGGGILPEKIKKKIKKIKQEKKFKKFYWLKKINFNCFS